MNGSNWMMRRWFDLRNGHNLYLYFFLSFIQFVVVVYALTPLKTTMNIYEFSIFLLSGYGAFATAIGYYYHRKKQLRSDQDSSYEQSHLFAKVQRIVLQAILGTATKEELEWALGMLKMIEDGKT